MGAKTYAAIGLPTATATAIGLYLVLTGTYLLRVGEQVTERDDNRVRMVLQARVRGSTSGHSWKRQVRTHGQLLELAFA